MYNLIYGKTRTLRGKYLASFSICVKKAAGTKEDSKKWLAKFGE